MTGTSVTRSARAGAPATVYGVDGDVTCCAADRGQPATIEMEIV